MTTDNTFETLSNALADAVESVDAALVQVNGRRRMPASGIVFEEGWVVTAGHVLEREENIHIGTHDGHEVEAQFAGRDMGSDLAVLRVEGLALPAATLAEQVRVGELALALGRPWGGSPMASLGVVSAVGGPLVGRGRRGGGPRWGGRGRGRRRRGSDQEESSASNRPVWQPEVMLERFIRTDATPYPGFSGGPLIGAHGNVLGVLTTGLIGGVTLAVPGAQAWQIAKSLSQHGRVVRGYLGISSQPVRLPNEVEGQQSGLLIVEVEPDSPASEAGLMLGDVLLALDGETVEETGDLRLLLTGDRVGNAVPVEVLRGGQRQQLTITVGSRD